MSKSGLLGLHSWLLDAMEGPTPVSALLHSATLVCAGVVLLGRCVDFVGGWSWLLGIGCWGALWACWLGVWFLDVKRVVALSTMVHVAVMVVGIGCCAGSGWLVSSGCSVGMAHLLSHAFSKASLFMCIGVLLHGAVSAMGQGQDVRG